MRVAPPNPSYGDNPYTLQPGGCGERGLYIHLTPDYLHLINSTMKQRLGPGGEQGWTLFIQMIIEGVFKPIRDLVPQIICAQRHNLQM